MKTARDYAEKISHEFITDLAESHIDAWKDRYFRKSKRDIRFDLNVNHDPSLEIEAAEELLGRKLTISEYDRLIRDFNNTVVRIIY